MTKTKPNIRFQGFEDDWEQRKLGEMADIVGGGTPSTKNDKYWNGDIDWYSPAEINNQIYVSGSQNQITDLGLQKSSARILPVGTVLFTSRAGIGKTVILAKEGTTNQGFQSILPHENDLDSYFIFSRTNELKHYGETNGAGSTFVEVSGKQMAKMPILLPKIEEQQKIGQLFKQLDKTIALHQRQLELLKEQKKGFLQKMFPKAGETVPEIRFSGFVDEWEKRKLDDMTENHNSGVYIPKDQYGKGINIIGVGDIYGSDVIDGRQYRLAPVKDERFILHSGDLLYGESSLVPEGIARVVSVNQYGAGTAFAWHTRRFRVNNKLNSQFLGLELDYWFPARSYLMRSATKTALTGITTRDFFNTYIVFPVQSEQEHIVGLISSLDSIINLKQRKVDILRELKRGFLQQMFV